MPTKTVATRLPEDLLRRLELVATVDRRSVAQVMAILIERGLPEWESEIAERAGGSRAVTPSSATIAAAEAIAAAAVRKARAKPKP